MIPLNERKIARVFLSTRFLFSLLLTEKKIQRKFILGKKSSYTATGRHRAEASRHSAARSSTRAALSMRDMTPAWRPIRKARRKKVFEKMDALPILSTRNFSPVGKFREFSRTQRPLADLGRCIVRLTYEFLVHVQRHVWVQVLLVVILAKV